MATAISEGKILIVHEVKPLADGVEGKIKKCAPGVEIIRTSTAMHAESILSANAFCAAVLGNKIGMQYDFGEDLAMRISCASPETNVVLLTAGGELQDRSPNKISNVHVLDTPHVHEREIALSVLRRDEGLHEAVRRAIEIRRDCGASVSMEDLETEAAVRDLVRLSEGYKVNGIRMSEIAIQAARRIINGLNISADGVRTRAINSQVSQLQGYIPEGNGALCKEEFLAPPLPAPKEAIDKFTEHLIRGEALGPLFDAPEERDSGTDYPFRRSFPSSRWGGNFRVMAARARGEVAEMPFGTRPDIFKIFEEVLDEDRKSYDKTK